jgi:hypothetical protein
MSLVPDRIVPWGRTLREYRAMFALDGPAVAGGVLDCGGGPASATAELAASGVRAVAVDPIYIHPGEFIRARFEELYNPMLDAVRARPEAWVWGFHRDPDALGAARRAALEGFLADYDAGRRAGRYVAGALPRLPFADGEFGLALCSHLLFLYSDRLDAGSHVAALREVRRVAREVRVFPLVALDGARSAHLAAAVSALSAAGFRAETVRVGYELQPGGNEMLRVA